MLFLLRILAFFGVFWVLQRLLMLFSGSRPKRARPQPPDGAASNTVKDPVCGMYMDPRLALRLQIKGEDLFFCSEDCRNRYQEEMAGRGK